jgi:hypothetical protein
VRTSSGKREGLSARKVRHHDAVVLKDEAISGTSDERPNYEAIRRMIDRREIAVLAVDDQSRLSRGHNVKSRTPFT